NGFVGRNLQSYVAKKEFNKKYHIVGVDREIDLLKKENILLLIKKFNPSYIINLVGNASSSDFEELALVNAILSERLLECVVSCSGVEKILLIGSAAEYGIQASLPISEDAVLNPKTPYGLSKVLQAQIFHYYADKIAVNLARTFNIIGPGIPTSLAVGAFVEKIKNA
ncbi:MAG: NAD-dependent epimerase/dehydratase family protein, partial [Oligoflexia bacterium]|nr:NAD-dependent epimerase/dehydratase family protein [Oligoflexia bacterium]